MESDHQPSTSIVDKPIGKLTTRLQIMLIKLLKGDFSIKFVPGSQMDLADTLSRASIKETGKQSRNVECCAFQFQNFTDE